MCLDTSLIRLVYYSVIFLVSNNASYFSQTSQMGMCGLSMTHDRYKFVQFSNIIYFGHITFLSKQPGLSSRQWIIFSPFTLNVWSLILILFIILAITIQSFSRFNSSNQSITFQDSLLQLVGIFLKQNIKRISCHASLRPFYACWLMFALVMSNAYGGRFYSMLALPKMEPPIDTIEEVVQLAMVDRIRITSYKSGSYLNDFLDARPETNNVYYQLGQNIRRTRPEMGKINKDFIDIVERSAIPTIFVSSRISLTFSNILYAHQPLHIASNHFKNDFYAIIFPKRSHLYRPFNRIILQSFEHGLIKHWTRNVYYQTPGALKNELAKINISQRIGALRLFDVYSILTFWILGNALAFFVFFLELASIVLN